MDVKKVNPRAIKVIGHRNPDTDSICAAITYSNLKNILDPEHPCKPCRAGLLNRETEFVLDYFKTPLPQLYTDVSPHIRDVDIRPAQGVDGEMSLRRAWMTMRDQQIDTLCIVDEGQYLKGVITVKDVATANMDGIDPCGLAAAKTSYQNLIDTLNGTVIVGDVTGKRVEGRIIIEQPGGKPVGRTGDGGRLYYRLCQQQGFPYDGHAGGGEGLHRYQHGDEYICGRADAQPGRPYPPFYDHGQADHLHPPYPR